jgi:acetyl-CoA carboxylase carboxyltransferase component
MVSKDMGFDKVIAWPTAEIAVMGAEQAVSIISRDEIAKNPKSKSGLAEEYTKEFLNPYAAARLGKVDMIIEPKETRIAIIKCLEMLLSKREKKPSKKHGNMPL